MSGVPSDGDAAFECFREGNRQLLDRITVRHDSNSLGNKQPYNQCVMAPLGQAAGEHWTGPLLAQSYKYRINDDLDEWNAEDRPEKGKPLIPTDLDTISLPPILSFMDWRATSVDDYNLDTNANKAAPGKASPETPSRKKASSENKRRKPVNTTTVKDEYDTEIEFSWTKSSSSGWT